MLIKLGGAERVLLEIMRMYPEADVYTLMYDEKKVGSVFPKNRIHCDTPAQTLYNLTGKPRLSLPLMPASIKKIDLTRYDLVISSSSGFAHGAFTVGNTKHICYCHSPARYLWDWSDEVQKEIGVKLDPNKKQTPLDTIKQSLGGPIVTTLLNRLRVWDTEAAKRPDIYVANSKEVQERIKKYYERDAVILWPPVDVNRFTPGVIPVSARKYYVMTTALTPFKRVDIAIRTFSKLGKNLKIIWAGEQESELRKIAWPTIEFLGRVDDAEVVKAYQAARGFLMPQKEDAGIAPIEALAAGIPVFWQGKGGLLEVNIDGVTGRFFPEETDESFEQWFLAFDAEITAGKYDHAPLLVERAKAFDGEKFRIGFAEVVNQVNT